MSSHKAENRSGQVWSLLIFMWHVVMITLLQVICGKTYLFLFLFFVLSSVMAQLMTGRFSQWLEGSRHYCDVNIKKYFSPWTVTFLCETGLLWDLGQHKKAKYLLCDYWCLRVEIIAWGTTVIAGAMSTDWNEKRDSPWSLMQGMAVSFCFNLCGIRMILKGSSMVASITLRMFYSQRL